VLEAQAQAAFAFDTLAVPCRDRGEVLAVKVSEGSQVPICVTRPSGAREGVAGLRPSV
jgi:hypothetical protein